MAEGRVNVFARVRGLNDREQSGFKAVSCEEKTCTVDDVEGAVEAALRSSGPTPAAGNKTVEAVSAKKTFELDGVFDEDTDQATVFRSVGLPVLNAALRGFNGCVFAYGMTGSGKTYSLLNTGGTDPSAAGLLPRLVATLFARAAMDGTHSVAVECAALQVYNEQVDDLLHPDYLKGQGHNISVGKGGAAAATWASCAEAGALLQLFANARKNIVYAETKMNKTSSRSHALFQLRISRQALGKAEQSTVSVLSVVDLAGSERVKRSGVQGAQFKEAVNINGSLLALGQVVSALAARKKHVPFRDSKLTKLLEKQLGGNCVTTLLTCCSPSADSTSETISALQFASRAMRVEQTAVINQVEELDLAKCLHSLAVVSKDPAVHDTEALQVAKKELDVERARRKDEMDALAKKQAAATSAHEAKLKEAARVADQHKSAALASLSKQKQAEIEKAVQEAREASAKALEAAKAQLQSEARRDVAAVQVTLETKVKEHAAVTSTLRGERDAYKAQSQAAASRNEAQNKAHALKVQSLEAAHSKQLDALASAKDADLAAVKNSAALTHSEAKERAGAQAAALEAQLLQAEAKLQAKAAELACETARLTEDLARAATRLEAATQRGHEDRANLVQTFEAEKSEMRTAFEARLAEQQGSMDALTKTHAATLSEATRLHEAAQAALRADLAALELQHQAVLDREAREHAATVETIHVDYRAQLDGLASKHDQSSKRAEHLQATLEALEIRAESEAAKAVSFKRQMDHLESERNRVAEELIAAHADHAAETKDREARRDAEMERVLLAHEARVATQRAEAETRTRRCAAAFSAARHVHRARGLDVEERLASLVRRFEARESRPEDLDAIRGLQSGLSAKQRKIREVENEKHQVAMQLEYERQTDRIFGNYNARAAKQPAASKTPRSANRPRTAGNNSTRASRVRPIQIINSNEASQPFRASYSGGYPTTTNVVL